jgi:hypothetical protein
MQVIQHTGTQNLLFACFYAHFVSKRITTLLNHAISWSGASETQWNPITGMHLPTRLAHKVVEAIVQEKWRVIQIVIDLCASWLLFFTLIEHT